LTYKEGTLERDESKYIQYLKEAAILGQPGAQEELATAYNRRNNEQEQILHYATLAASHGNSRACGMLGHFFMRAECGLTESLILGKHYSEMYFEDGRRRPLQPSIRIQLIVSIVSSWLGSV
jgi:TPR repeat protein